MEACRQSASQKNLKVCYFLAYEFCTETEVEQTRIIVDNVSQ